MNWVVASKIVLVVVCVILFVAAAILFVGSSPPSTHRERGGGEGFEEEKEGEEDDDDSIDVDLSDPVADEEDVLNFRGKDVVQKKADDSEGGVCSIKGVPMFPGWTGKSGDPHTCAVDLSAVQHHCDKSNRRFYVPGVVEDMHMDPVSGACDVSFASGLEEKTVANYKKLVDVLEPKRQFIARTLEEIQRLKEKIEEQKEEKKRYEGWIRDRREEYRELKAKWRKVIAKYRRVLYLEGETATGNAGADKKTSYTDDDDNNFEIFHFNTPGKDAEFEVTKIGRFDVMVIGGGGSGGKNEGSGGGAGGVVLLSNLVLPAGKYLVRVGRGGKGHEPDVEAANGEAGEDSRFGPYVAYGGGGGNGKAFGRHVKGSHWLWDLVLGIDHYVYRNVRTGGAGGSGGSGGGGGGRAIQGRLDTYTEEGPAAVLYEHVNYQGRSLELHNLERYDMYDLKQAGFPNDKLSSVSVRPGVRVTLYEHMNLEGAALPLESSTPDLRKLDAFNDLTSSILVEKTDRRPGTMPTGAWLTQLGNDGGSSRGEGGSVGGGAGGPNGKGLDVRDVFGKDVGVQKAFGRELRGPGVAEGGLPAGAWSTWTDDGTGGGGYGIKRGNTSKGSGSTGLVLVRRLRDEYKGTAERARRLNSNVYL